MAPHDARLRLAGRATWAWAILWMIAGPGSAHAAPLSLSEAVTRAVDHNASLRASAAAVDAAGARVGMARSALLPRIDFSESAEYTDQPVAAFGALLGQERLQPEDLAIDALNDPDPLTDFVSRLDLRASLIDVSAWYALRAAARHEDAAKAARRSAEAQVVAATVQLYYRVQLADAALAVARDAAEAARADVERARARRDGGMGSEAAVLGLETELASLEEVVITATGETEVSRAELARVLGAPAGARFELTTPLDAPLAEVPDGTTLRPDHPALARAEADLAAAEARRASALWAFAPTLGLGAGVERHREDFLGDGATHFYAGVTLRLNLFNGLGDLARLHAAEADEARAAALRDDARVIREVALGRARRAVSEARARREVATRAVAHARESHRIERARLESGMTGAADVLRARAALLDAERRHLAASYAQHVAAVDLAAALGILDRTFVESAE